LKNLILIIILAHTLACCKQAAQADVSGAPLTNGLSTSSSFEVVTTAERNTAIRAKAVVKSLNNYTMVSNENSIIQNNYFTVGATVPKGALILALDNAEELLMLNKAKMQLQEARFEYEETLSIKDSAYYIKKGNWNSLKERTAYKMGLPQAEVDYQQAQLALKRTRCYAPFTGVLASLWKRSGETVKAGETLGFLYDPAHLVAELALIEYDYDQIQVGNTGVISTMSSNSQIYQGKLTAKDAAINNKGFFRVQISLDKADGLVPGLNASVTIYTASVQCIAVPAEAIVTKSGKYVVFTYQSGLAKWNYVTKGTTFDDAIEIVDGLQEGDTILVNNVFQLAHDSEVVLANPIMP